MKKIIIVFAAFFGLFSCVETAVIGFGAGSIIATRNKSLKDTKDDVLISAKIDKEFVKNGLKNPTNYISVMVSEGRVLLVGAVYDVDKAKKAVEISWKVKNVKELIDEIEVRDEKVKVSKFAKSFSDSYLTAKIKTKLFFNRKISSADYKILSFNGSVYLLGIAENRAQLEETLDVISKTSGVKKVVNHAILENDSRRNR